MHDLANNLMESYRKSTYFHLKWYFQVIIELQAFLTGKVDLRYFLRQNTVI